MTSWTLTYPSRPWTTNAERSMHWSTRAALTREWRGVFKLLCREQRIPPCGRIRVTATPHLKGRQQDPGACHPAVKAAVDGLVDAGLVRDDTAEFVDLRICAPVKAKGDALVLLVEDLTRGSES